MNIKRTTRFPQISGMDNELDSIIKQVEIVTSTSVPAHNHVISNIIGLAGAIAGKADAVHSHSNATQSTNGFMSATDKIKLDGLNNNTSLTFLGL